jgi:hypothetical protein
MQNGGKSPQNRPSSAQNKSDSNFSWIFQQPMDGDNYAYVVLWATSFLGESSCLSKISHGKQENPRITVSVFLRTFKLTALLLNKIHLLLHCYTLIHICIQIHVSEREFFSQYIIQNKICHLRPDTRKSHAQ